MPLTPLFVKAREVDVIVAIDASSDDPNLWVKYVFLLYQVWSGISDQEIH
jgi:hypothetical protein